MSSTSGSSAPMWKPVTPSLTVSTSPPVDAQMGTVPYCIACSYARKGGGGLVKGRGDKGPTTLSLPDIFLPHFSHTWMRPQGSKREGTMMKSAPAVMRCAKGALNLTTPCVWGRGEGGGGALKSSLWDETQSYEGGGESDSRE